MEQSQAGLSNRAVSCFVHGLAHLFSELGPEKGLEKGIQILSGLAERGLGDVLAGVSSQRIPRHRRAAQFGRCEGVR